MWHLEILDFGILESAFLFCCYARYLITRLCKLDMKDRIGGGYNPSIHMLRLRKFVSPIAFDLFCLNPF